MKNYDYSKIDPIIRANPDIKWGEFKKKCPVKCSNWSFNARKFALRGEKGYGNNNPSVNQKPAVESVDAVVEKIRPNAVLKNDYKRVAEILLKDIETTYRVASKHIRMSDATYYHFRRDLIRLLKGVPGQQVSLRTPIKRKLLYTTLYEKEVNGSLDPKSLNLLQEFIEVLNQERILNAELFEITHPRHIIEIRSFSK
jgi:hypothetical protein